MGLVQIRVPDANEMMKPEMEHKQKEVLKAND